GHGFSLLALTKGMSTLFAKNGFSRPSLERYCGVFRHVLGLRLLAPPKIFIPAGVNGPPLQTNIVIVKASYTVLLSNTLAKEIHEDSSGKAKTMRPHSERSLRVRRLIASPRKA